jgi:magnesium chelatase accessory protein
VDRESLDWDTDGPAWPLHEYSRFVTVGAMRWHVQQAGSGPTLLLLHGTGASTHSFRALVPLLARWGRVVAPDLPGHGFSAALPGARPGIGAQAQALAALLAALDAAPALIVGHSAGAALAVRMTLDGLAAPASIVSLNGALLPWHGVPGAVFAPLARLLSVLPLVPRLFAARARSPTAVARLIASTGSTLAPDGLALYARLLRSPPHVAGALAMMANWDLTALERDLVRLATPLLLVVGERDLSVPPASAARIVARLPATRVARLAGLGHLAHEEDPPHAAALIEAEARRAGLAA